MAHKRSLVNVLHSAFHNTLSVVSKEAEDAGAASFLAGVVLNSAQILAFPFGASSPLNKSAAVRHVGP